MSPIDEGAPLRLTLAAGTRQVAKARTRERIREAARALFLSRGFSDTTTQLVADQAKVAVGTLFQHASDKEDLLLLVVHGPLADAVTHAGGLPPSDNLLTELTVLFGSLLEVYAELDLAAQPALRAHWFGSGPNARGVQWLHETFLEQVVVRLERARARGTLTSGADARVLAGNLSSLYQGVLLQWLWTDDGLDVALASLRAAFALQIIPLQATTPEAPL